jgi:hypothetical protein
MTRNTTGSEAHRRGDGDEQEEGREASVMSASRITTPSTQRP